ncbi:MAG: type IV secretion system protein VirB10 [Rhodocyclales bacterium]|nr:type IV secretion system protein VirB10 [Rhodocyclales bacterium]
MNTETSNSSGPQLEGDAIPGLTPARKQGMSMKAVLALAFVVLSIGAVSAVVAKRYLDSKHAAQPQKTPEVASATAQRLRMVDPKAATLPQFQGIPASAPDATDPAGQPKPKVPAISEAGEVKPIAVVRNGDAKPNPGGGQAGRTGPQTAPTLNPMDAPVFASQTRGTASGARLQQARGAGMGTGAADVAADEEARASSLSRTMEELRAHKARLEAEIERQTGKSISGGPAPDRPIDRARDRAAEAQSAVAALANRFGSPILPDAAASQAGSGRLLGGLEHSGTAQVSAKRPFNRTLTVPKGTIFQCALQTRVVTATSGFVNCLVQLDVYGHDGKVVLVERGSSLVGEYRMLSVRPGLTRIPVVWTRVLTPTAVSVDLESPAVGQLGESGIGGYVDSRWPERIGAALLLSMADDAIKLASQRQDSNGNTVYLPSTTSQGSKLAEDVLKSTINIPPLLYQNQGGVVGVYVARDLDFSGVYRLVAQ